jgi:hypothetical protein
MDEKLRLCNTLGIRVAHAAYGVYSGEQKHPLKYNLPLFSSNHLEPLKRFCGWLLAKQCWLETVGM